MISDVLSGALDEIERYLGDPAFAKAYSDPAIQERIEALAKEMRETLAMLDAQPAMETDD